MRGLAVLLVVLYHTGLPVPGGFVGVDVFFVISGYVITGGILKALHSEKGFSFKDFYLRRIRRLLPALSVVLTLATLLGILLGPDVSQKVSGRTAVAASLLNANHYLYRGAGYFDPSAELNIFLHTWSLSVEEQFYLFFPFFIVSLWWLGRRRVSPSLNGLKAGVFLLTFVTFSVGVWLTYTPSVLGINAPRFAFFSSITRAWEFGAGALVATFLPFLSERKAKFELWGWIGLLCILSASFLFTKDTMFPGFAALLPVVGSMLLLLPGIGKDSGFTKLFTWKPLVRMGDLSYAWYLWHWPIIVFAHATWPGSRALVVLVGFGSISLAWLTERYVESPVRFRPVESRKPTWVVAVVCVLAPIRAWVVQPQFVGRAHVVAPELAELRRLEMEYRAFGCLKPLDYKDSDECRWGDRKAPKVVLLGDSNARQFVPVLRRVTDELGLQLHAATYPSCPLVGRVYSEGLINQTCLDWRERTLDAILEEAPALVIMSMATELYVYDDRRSVQSPHWSPDQRLDHIRTQMTAFVDQFSAANVSAVVLDSTPKFYGLTPFSYPNPNHCSLLGIVMGSARCGSEMTHAEATVRIENVSLNVGEISLMKEICPGSVCRMKVGETWYYVDGGHLNSNGVDLLEDRFRQLLTSRLNP